MTHAEILKRLFRAFVNGDTIEFTECAEDLIEKERGKNHKSVAKELQDILYSKPSNNKYINGKKYKTNIPVPRDTDKGFPLLEIKKYYFSWNELILPQRTIDILKQIVQEFQDKEILESYNLKHKNKILFCGAPGTGKTFSAQILSSVLHIPVAYVRFDSIISSFLGETAKNLRKIFDFISNGMWIVLFDEFDVIGKNRNDQYEHGELKRVVNNFLQMLDNFEGESLIIASTNHQHMLDPAIWRRFDDVIYFDLPDEKDRLTLLELYLKPIPKSKFKLDKFASLLNGFSPSDIKGISIEAMKLALLDKREILSQKDLEQAINRFKDRENVKKGF